MPEYIEGTAKPEAKIAPETLTFPATDLRTGTEVDPAVVAHHAAFLAGAPYSDPYPAPPAAPKKEAK